MDSMARARVIVGVALPIAIVVGCLGAWAFNPDTGAVLHSEVLWRIFGVMCEGALFVLMGLVVLLAVSTLVQAMLRFARPHRP